MKLRNLGLALIVVGAIVAYQKADAFESFTKETKLHFSDSEADHLLNEDEEVMLDESFRLESGDLLLARLEHSDLEIKRGSGNNGRVVITLEASDMDRGRAFYERLNFEVEESSRGLAVTTSRRKGSNWNWNNSGRVEIRTVITLPQHYDLDMEISHGNIVLEDGRGNVDLQASHGNLDVGTFEGDTIALRLSHGDSRIEALSGDDVTILASHGDVNVGSVSARTIEARLSHGDLEIDSASGSIVAENSHGDLDLTLANNDGARLRNSHGDITIYTDSDLASEVDFDGDSIKISSGFDFQGTIKNERATGNIRGGGPLLSARTSHGSISLRQR